VERLIAQHTRADPKSLLRRYSVIAQLEAVLASQTEEPV
jgi:hypothetical protein